MTYKYTKSTAITALVIAAGTMAFNPVFAGQSGAQVSISSNGFSPISVDVVSLDRKKWTTVKTKQLLLNVKVALGARGLYVEKYFIRQGWSGSGVEIQNDNPWLFTRDFGDKSQVLRVDKALSVVGSTAYFTPGERTKFVRVCNAKLKNGGSIHKSYQFFSSVKMKLQAVFVEGSGLPSEVGRGKTDSGAATVTVKCIGVQAAANDLVAKEPKDLKVKSLQLFRSTYSHATSKPNPGTVCKKARLLVRLKTNKAGPVKFKLWTKIGDQAMASKVIDTWSHFSGPGEFTAEYTQWVSVSKTSFVQAKAEEMVNAIGMSTSWKSITLHCTGAGGGGLADAPQPDDDGPLVQPLKVTGVLTLADKAGAPKDKPRLGAAVFKLWATKPGKTAYRLNCSGGRQWTGTLSTFKVGSKKYQAVGQHNFQIAKTETIGCALRSTSLPTNAVVALASKKFRLVRRNPNLGGSGDITVAPQPKAKAGVVKRLKDKAEKARKRRQAIKKALLLKRRAAAKKSAQLKKRRLEKLNKTRNARVKARRAAANKAAVLKRRKAARAKAAQARRLRLLRKKKRN